VPAFLYKRKRNKRLIEKNVLHAANAIQSSILVCTALESGADYV
jgi:hypothetical protein